MVHAVVIALTVVCADVSLCAGWTVLAWGLRGASYEEGRPTAEDELSVAAGWAMLVIVVLMHVVAPIGGALARRWAVPIGVLLGTCAAPLAYAAISLALALYVATLP
jgi:hypothetical protein